MAVPITVGGQIVVLPSQSDKFAWGTAVTSALVLLAANTLQTTGGLQSLTAELDLGSAFGLKALYFKSRTANVASTGILRMANADFGAFRNQANNADLKWGPGDGVSTPVDQFQFNGTQVTGNPFATAHRITSAQSGIGASPTTVIFNNTDLDTDGAYNNSSGVFTVPTNKSGVYAVAASVNTTQSTSTGNQSLQIVGNSIVATANSNFGVTAGTSLNLTCSAVINLAAGQTIVAQLSTTAGTVSANVSTGTSLSVKRLV